MKRYFFILFFVTFFAGSTTFAELMHYFDGVSGTPRVVRKQSCNNGFCVVIDKGVRKQVPESRLKASRPSNLGSVNRPRPAPKRVWQQSAGGEFGKKRGHVVQTLYLRKKENSPFLMCYLEKATDNKVSGGYCYRGVKKLLRACKAAPPEKHISGRHAKNAGSELLRLGFVRQKTKNPRQASNGCVIVYDSKCGHKSGHIEVKLADEIYVSDYRATLPRSEITRCRPVKGIYCK